MSRTTALLLLSVFLLGFDYGSVTRANAHSHSPALGSWFRRVSSSGADGAWLFGWAWGADSTVTVVDHSPQIMFASRPASFGPLIEDSIMGYGILMNAFTVECEDQSDSRRKLPGGGGRFGSLLGAQVDGLEENIGCPKLCLAEGKSGAPSDSWIAIVQRGQCAFVDKVREAQRFGAKAVIVGGDDPDKSGNPDTLVGMYSQGDASDVDIPSTFIKYSDYARLNELIEKSSTSTSGIKTVSLQITTDYALWEWYSPILTFIVLLLLPSSLTLLTLLIHRIRAVRAERRERAPEDVVNSLPWRVWTGTGWEKQHDTDAPDVPKPASDLENGDPNAEMERSQECPPSTSHPRGDLDDETVLPPWFDSQTECAICLNDFVKGDRVRLLPCNHIFHMTEVDEWLIHRKKLCPVCKADVTQPSNPYPQHDVVPEIAIHAQDTTVTATHIDHSTTDTQSQISIESHPSSTSRATERTPLLPSRQLHDYTHANDSSPENPTRE